MFHLFYKENFESKRRRRKKKRKRKKEEGWEKSKTEEIRGKKILGE